MKFLITWSIVFIMFFVCTIVYYVVAPVAYQLYLREVEMAEGLPEPWQSKALGDAEIKRYLYWLSYYMFVGGFVVWGILVSSRRDPESGVYYQ